jgi:hypothetical protein
VKINKSKVVHERVGEAQIRDLITGAKIIFFLGFGYREENLEILKAQELLTDDKEIFGTALGFYDREIHNIGRLLNKSRKPLIENIDCLTLLRKYL